MIRSALRRWLGISTHRRSDFRRMGVHVELPSDGIIADKQNIEIDDFVYLGPQPYIFARGGLKIGRNVIIGPRVTIHTTNHRYDSERYLPYDDVSYLQPVVIEKNVWIGSSVLICPGVRLGEGCVVAMGAVVTKSFDAGSIVGGNPASVIKLRDMKSYGELENKQAHYLVAKSRGGISTSYLE